MEWDWVWNDILQATVSVTKYLKPVAPRWDALSADWLCGSSSLDWTCPVWRRPQQWWQLGSSLCLLPSILALECSDSNGRGARATVNTCKYFFKPLQYVCQHPTGHIEILGQPSIREGGCCKFTKGMDIRKGEELGPLMQVIYPLCKTVKYNLVYHLQVWMHTQEVISQDCYMKSWRSSVWHLFLHAWLVCCKPRFENKI